MPGGNDLNVFLNAKIIAHVSLHEDQLTWKYTQSWQKNGFAISPHLPLTKPIPSLNVQRFLRNLLPEGSALEELTTCYNISKNNTFALMRKLGLDMPGAIVLLPTDTPYPKKGEFIILPEHALVQRLNDRAHNSLIIWDNKPRLSVAGIQDKINIVLNKHNQMGFGEGSICSTHLLKFEKQKLVHLVLNEYMTMQLAAACDLHVANVTLKYFDTHAALLVKRFDRFMDSENHIERKHMIDGCQALNMPPECKHERNYSHPMCHSPYVSKASLRDGGIFKGGESRFSPLKRKQKSHFCAARVDKYERNFGSGRDVAHIRDGVNYPALFTFAEQCINPALTKKMMLDWVLFNILVFNCDAHGKNISFFVSDAGISLAPFYDLINIKLYEKKFDQDMAMALGDEFDSNTVNAYQLADFADSCQLPRTLVKKQLQLLIKKLQTALDIDFESQARDFSEKNYIAQYKKHLITRCSHLSSELANITHMPL